MALLNNPFQCAIISIIIATWTISSVTNQNVFSEEEFVLNQKARLSCGYKYSQF